MIRCVDICAVEVLLYGKVLAILVELCDDLLSQLCSLSLHVVCSKLGVQVFCGLTICLDIVADFYD